MSAQYRELMRQREAYFKKVGYQDTNDCTVISIAIAARIEYGQAHEAFKLYGRERGKGASYPTCWRVLRFLGFHHHHIEKSTYGGRTVKTLEKELYKKARGRTFLISVRGHVLAFNGVNVCDWTKGRRHHVTAITEVIPNEETRTTAP